MQAAFGAVAADGVKPLCKVSVKRVWVHTLDVLAAATAPNAACMHQCMYPDFLDRYPAQGLDPISLTRHIWGDLHTRQHMPQQHQHAAHPVGSSRTTVPVQERQALHHRAWMAEAGAYVPQA